MTEDGGGTAAVANGASLIFGVSGRGMLTGCIGEADDEATWARR
jgi:hypothetical protein